MSPDRFRALVREDDSGTCDREVLGPALVLLFGQTDLDDGFDDGCAAREGV